METEDKRCEFVTNVPYAFISSALTFWIPVILMVLVYYRVYREAMKQKTAMEKMTNIRTLPTARNMANDPAISEVRNGQDRGEKQSKPGSTSPTRKGGDEKADSTDSVPVTNGDLDLSSKSLKRISLESAMYDARAKARNSIFVSSGTNILEGMANKRNGCYCPQITCTIFECSICQ